MYRKKRVLLILAIFSIGLVAFLYIKTWQHIVVYFHASRSFLINESDLEKEIPSSQSVSFHDGDYELIVNSNENLEDCIIAPCPVDKKTAQYMEEILQPIVFSEAEKGRVWSNFFFEDNSFIFKEKLLLLRRLLGLLAKAKHENSHLVFGLSGGGELLAMAKIAICDILAQLHYHIQGGIIETIDFVSTTDIKNQESITEEQRYALKRLYAMCRMTSSLSHKFSSFGFARASFEPTDLELKEAFRLFKIDREKSKDIVCYYRKKKQ